MNIVEISNRFPSEEAAILYLEQVRWKNTPRCAYCESSEVSAKHTKDFRRKCRSCNKTSSVTVNTYLHDTRLPIKTWLFAFSIITDAKKGLSAMQLQRNIDVSYPTAHSMYMRIRRMMAEPTGKLDDVVEMDETFIGGKPRKGANPDCLPPKNRKKLDDRIEELEEEGFEFKEGTWKVACDVDIKRGRGSQKMVPVVGIVERDGNVVAEVMQHLTSQNLTAMVKKHVDEDDSVIITDSYRGYSQLHRIIEHVKIDHHEMYSYKGVNTNTIESFWAIIERGIIGQYHHVSRKYLPQYITEFVFKFNNRNNDDMFETLVKKAVQRTA